MSTYYNPYYYSNFQSPSEVSLFNGDGVDQWLNQIEGFFIRYQVIPEQKLAVADRYLTEEALDWYQQWHREIWWCSYHAATWEEFVGDLKIRFKPPEIQMTHAEIDDSFWRKWDELKQMVREMKSDHLASIADLSSKRNFFAPIKSVFNPVIESVHENMESASIEFNKEPDDNASDLSTNVVEESDDDDLIVDISISSAADSFSALQTKVSFNTTYGIYPQVLNQNNDTLDQPQGDGKCEMLVGDLNGIEHPYFSTVCENASMCGPFVFMKPTHIVDASFLKPPAKPPDGADLGKIDVRKEYELPQICDVPKITIFFICDEVHKFLQVKVVERNDVFDKGKVHKYSKKNVIMIFEGSLGAKSQPFRISDFETSATTTVSSSLFELFDTETKPINIDIYVRRVFIMHNFEELISKYLGLATCSVNYEEMSLNIFLEVLKHNKINQNLYMVDVSPEYDVGQLKKCQGYNLGSATKEEKTKKNIEMSYEWSLLNKHNHFLMLKLEKKIVKDDYVAVEHYCVEGQHEFKIILLDAKKKGYGVFIMRGDPKSFRNLDDTTRIMDGLLDEEVVGLIISMRINKFLIFSLPRPPEVTDLEDKVNFKEGIMIRTEIMRNIGDALVLIILVGKLMINKYPEHESIANAAGTLREEGGDVMHLPTKKVLNNCT